jgi:hypothetical protein
LNWKNATIKQWIFGITILSSMVLVCVTTIFLFWKGGRAVLALDSADLFETAAVYAPPKSYKRENPYESLEQFQTQGPIRPATAPARLHLSPRTLWPKGGDQNPVI